MISKEHNCIFVHVQKTGGTSVRRALKGYSHRHKTVRGYITMLKTYDNFKKYFSFTFVRNPWDRILSVYFAHRQWYAAKVFKGVRVRVPSPAVQKLEFNNWLAGLEDGQVALPDIGMRDFMRGQVYRLEYNGRICVNFVGRFERLAEDWKIISKRIGLNRQLPHDGKTRHGTYAKYYEMRGIEVVRRIFAEDIDAFGYKFEKAGGK